MHAVLMILWIRLIGQKRETESETWKSQMYGHNAANLCHPYNIRASVDALFRDGAGKISRDPRTKHLKTRRK